VTRVVLIDEVGDLDAARAALAGHPEVAVERSDTLPTGEDVVGLLVGTEVEVGAPQLAAVPAVRIVAATATGYDHLALAEIAAVGAWATHCPGYCDVEVAEHAIAFALDLLRGVTLLDRAVHAGRYDYLEAPGRRVTGAVLGIVGLGRIGREVARRADALGMRVLAADPIVDPAASAPAELVELGELLAAADVVTLHAPLTEHTRELIGAGQLVQMRSDAYLVNCARTGLVDHDALGEALNAGRLGGCALDVLPQEPPRDDEPALDWPPDDHQPPLRLVLTAVGSGSVPDRRRGGRRRARGTRARGGARPARQSLNALAARCSAPRSDPSSSAAAASDIAT
jgi:D-3-phosphoglycerate dehydrogenase